MRNFLNDALVRKCDLNQNVKIASDKFRKDSYVVFTGKGKDAKIHARIYKYNEQWYIYYQKPACRIPVPSFTHATAILDREVQNCVEQTGM